MPLFNCHGETRLDTSGLLNNIMECISMKYLILDCLMTIITITYYYIIITIYYDNNNSLRLVCVQRSSVTIIIHACM